jgi:uncharacterized protein YndB with AHSA1/START domain
MNLEVDLEEVLPHPVKAVWEALTDSASISEWLMQTTDFEPVVGTRFRMKTDRLLADGWVKAEVLELNPPRRMVWAWWVDAAAPTTVTFELAPEGDDTRLRLTHVGEIDERPGRMLRDGWPGRIDELRRSIDRA